MVNYDKLSKEELIERIKELETKNSNLIESKTLEFVQFQQILGSIFKEIHKNGVTCKNCKHCYKIIKKNGKEEYCCTFYKKFYNLDIEPIKSLCENFKSNKGEINKCHI